MRLGEFLTRSSIWLALAGYFTGSMLLAVSRERIRLERVARLAWTLGCASLIIHFIFAFNFYHHWNHDTAYAEIARQTRAVVGLDWGGGLYINYTILVLWMLDTASWWRTGLEGYRRRSKYLTLLWQALLLFIIFNATVVFKGGVLRWIGILMSALLILTWVSFVTSRSRSTTT
jgi:hypothetical protein